jgi:hypothetical protein
MSHHLCIVPCLSFGCRTRIGRAEPVALKDVWDEPSNEDTGTVQCFDRHRPTPFPGQKTTNSVIHFGDMTTKACHAGNRTTTEEHARNGMMIWKALERLPHDTQIIIRSRKSATPEWKIEPNFIDRQ